MKKQYKNYFLLNLNNKFKKYSNDWWNLKGNLKTLHQINPIRLQYILNHSNGLNNKKVIDIGCGGGILTESMADQGAIVTGIDICRELIELANIRSLRKNKKIKYLQQDICDHAKKFIEYYDVITCMELLEHVENPYIIINECVKILKPGGKIFFSTINRTKKAYFMIIVAAEYMLNMIPLGTHNINKFIKPSELLNWLDQAKLLSTNIIGLHYNFFSKKFFLASGIDMNYLVCAHKDIN